MVTKCIFPEALEHIFPIFQEYYKQKTSKFPSYFQCRNSALVDDFPFVYREIFANLYMLDVSLHNVAELYYITAAKKTIQAINKASGEVYSVSVRCLIFYDKYPMFLEQDLFPDKLRESIIERTIETSLLLDSLQQKKVPKKVSKEQLVTLLLIAERYNKNLQTIFA